jgi:hypothetical protein
MRGLVVAVVVFALVSSVASADDGITVTREPAPSPPSRHLVYVELLGKGGLYGIGYEYTIAPWLAVGGAASYSQIRDQQVATASPYLHVTALKGRRHALFGEVGAILAHSHVPSPVMDWDGVSDTGGGGFLALGWQYARRHVVVRTSAGVAAGEGGLQPMIGIAIGARP